MYAYNLFNNLLYSIIFYFILILYKYFYYSKLIIYDL